MSKKYLKNWQAAYYILLNLFKSKMTTYNKTLAQVYYTLVDNAITSLYSGLVVQVFLC